MAELEPELQRAVNSTVRTIYFSSWEQRQTEAGELLVYRVRGNGFLHHMVRNLAGTMIDVGRGQLALEEIPGILAARSRSAAGPTAPARGLFLHSVEYDDRDLLFARIRLCIFGHLELPGRVPGIHLLREERPRSRATNRGGGTMAVQESGVGGAIPASGAIDPTGPQTLPAGRARAVVRKVQIWVLPFLLLLYVVSVSNT